ncbi:hypothetical protein K788_0001021 [Paraburkholderia caribensis MBA4]|uniref:Uncharacterized protein n=1 Tax=Paraburkholderia caribensis MBA4 TaxID=1323664 RepID=A0A0P0RH27_9BURK|nr:hypothetical protein [Paraburkholderia caribensis]ALL67862.1 hypothetical protein K788_0001021 [Paraburkholderia caribensis MBA4]
MQKDGKGLSSAIYLSTYAGRDSRLQRFVGMHCLVFEQAASEWKRYEETERSLPFFSLSVAKNEKTAVLILETRMGDCFHYALMNMSDPKLCKTLDVWVRNRGFVVVRKLAGSISFGLCPLDRESLQFLKKHRKYRYESNPEEFLRCTQSFIELKTFEQLATAKLSGEGHGSIKPVVEVQILESAAVRIDIPWQQMGKETHVTIQDTSDGNLDEHHSASVPVQIGFVQKACDFTRTSKSASAMKPDTPVLVSSVDLNRYLSLARVDGSFGFGHFRFEDRIVLSMRFQSGSAQIYWLADAADPSVWDAIDVMKKNEEVGFMLEEGARGAFVPYTLLPHQEDIRILRAESLSHPDGLSDAAVELANSGLVQKNATTDIPGIKLEYVHVNVLASESVARVLEALQASFPVRDERYSDSFETDIADAGHPIH